MTVTQDRLHVFQTERAESRSRRQVLTLNVPLTVGATTTTVEVQATAGAELQTLNATVGTTITNESLNLLPNLGRDASALSVLQVGVSLAGNVAGAATDQNKFSLDGGNNSDDMAGSNTTYTVPATAISGTRARRRHADRRDADPDRVDRRIQSRHHRPDRGLQRRGRQPGADGDQARNQCVPRRGVRILLRQQRRRGESLVEQPSRIAVPARRLLRLRSPRRIATATAARSVDR